MKLEYYGSRNIISMLKQIALWMKDNEINQRGFKNE
jgi:hypothetical protein